MQLTIHTYGYIDAAFYVLNGIAMLMNSTFGEVVMTTMAMITASYYGVKISYVGGGDYQRAIKQILAMIAMISIMLVPRAEMTIYDHVSKKREKVDNLPVGFALPVGVLEAFGDIITSGFEQAFTPVGNSDYRNYGMVFGARLVQESRSWRIRTPEFAENMSNFIDRCVMIEAAIGHNYTPQDLVTTDDVWGLVSRNSGVLRQVSMRIGKEKIMMSCRKAATDVLEPAFRSETGLLEKKYAASDFGGAGYDREVPRSFVRPNTNFKKNIEIAFSNYMGSRLNAENLMRQQMMINSMANYADEYGYARTLRTQESNWAIAGSIAATYLPILLTLFKLLLYSSFIFLFPLLIMSGGWQRYIGYLTLVTSFQLWAPLNAVLNMFIDLYSSNSLKTIADGIVSFSTMSRAGNYTDKIVAVASGLQMVIPYLAFSIIQGGVGGFIHLAGTITGASSSAASQAANESVTGNKSFDNYSVGNEQRYNANGFKTDWNQSYAAGSSSYQHFDGSMEKVTAGGNSLMQSGIGLTTSSGATSYRLDDSRMAQVNQGVQHAESIHEQDARSLADAKSKSFAKTADYVSHLAQREHAGESFNYDSMGEQGKALQQAVNHTKQLHDRNGYGWEQAAKASVEASVSGSTPKLLGFGISGGASGSVANTNSSDQSVSTSNTINRDNNINETYNDLVKAASNSSWAKENSIDTNFSNSVRGSYEEQKRFEQIESMSKQKVDDWHHAKSIIESRGGNSSQDMYQEVVDQIKQDAGVDNYTASKMASSNSPEARRAWQKIQSGDHYVQDLVNGIDHDKGGVVGEKAVQLLTNFTNENSHKVNDDTYNEVKTHAQNKGMEAEQMKNQMQEKQQDLRQKHNNITAENAVQYKSMKSQNELEERELQQEVNQYEKDRIGKGKFAKWIAKGLDEVTGGHAGSSIGKPDRNSSNKIEGAYENAEQIKNDNDAK